MGCKVIDLTGQRFGKLTAISFQRKGTAVKDRIFWTCKCDCGRETIVRSRNLISGNTQSCGCLRGRWKREK